MKKLPVFVTLLLVASFFLTAAGPGFYRPVRLTIINRTNSRITVKLFRNEKVYLLKPATGSSLFTIQPGKYRVTTWACGTSSRQDITILTNFRITIPRCNANLKHIVEEANLRKIIFREPQ